MAIVICAKSLLMDTMNFNRVIAGFVDSQFYDNANIVVNGRTYQDVLEVVYYFQGSRDAYFAGTGFAFDAFGNVSAGTVTGYVEYDWNGSSWQPWWSLEAIAISAPTLYGAFLTSSAIDDYTLIQQMLAGADQISGGPSTDSLLGYGGNDTIQGGAGNDLIQGGVGDDAIDGGSGTDIAIFQGSASQYRIGYNGLNAIVSGPDGVDALTNVEQLKFGSAAAQDWNALFSQGSASELMAVNTGGNISYSLPEAYSGPVSTMKYQLLGVAGPEISGGTNQNDFFNLLGGDDAANGVGGDDILDGGTGSNFLTGGAGRDIFFLDGRGGTTTWSTVTDWQAGEELAIWGWTKGVSTGTWVDQDGVAGWTGVTFHGDLNGNGTVDTSVTWTGVTRGQLPIPLDLFDGLLWFK